MKRLKEILLWKHERKASSFYMKEESGSRSQAEGVSDSPLPGQYGTPSVSAPYSRLCNTISNRTVHHVKFEQPS